MIIHILLSSASFNGINSFVGYWNCDCNCFTRLCSISVSDPINDIVLSPLEQKCQQIANEGYKIHAIYPDSNPDELPDDEMKRLMYLDEIWMKECISTLPADSIINIANNVDRNFSYGE